MIFGVRLRPFNKKAGNKMKTYLSGSRTKYTVGESGRPSPIRVVTSRKELHELREYPQFEIIPFDSRAELDKFVSREVFTLVRQGHPAVRPAILKGPQEPKKEGAVTDDDAGDETDGEPSIDDLFPTDEADVMAGLDGGYDDENAAQTAVSVSPQKEKPAKDLAPTAKAKPKNTGRKKKTSGKSSKKKTS